MRSDSSSHRRNRSFASLHAAPLRETPVLAAPPASAIELAGPDMHLTVSNIRSIGKGPPHGDHEDRPSRRELGHADYSTVKVSPIDGARSPGYS